MNEQEQITINKEEYTKLKSCSYMLGVIGDYVEDFCEEEDTTLVGVLNLLQDYYNLKSFEVEKAKEYYKIK